MTRLGSGGPEKGLTDVERTSMVKGILECLVQGNAYSFIFRDLKTRTLLIESRWQKYRLEKLIGAQLGPTT